jgi:hypothetical protein
MKENFLKGDTSFSPFPRLLFSLWQKEKSGQLRIQRGATVKRLHFEKGNIILEPKGTPENDFLRILVERKALLYSLIEECRLYAKKNSISFSRALIELKILMPSELWHLREDIYKEDLFPVFDWPQAEYLFETSQPREEFHLLSVIPTLDFILQGVRRMQDYEFIQFSLPPETEILQSLSPSYLTQLSFEPHEKYVLHMFQSPKSPRDIYATSEIGKKESQKVLFSLLCLEVISTSQQKDKNRPSHEISSSELDKILTAFNDKCSYIYKYISKELGPVALNVIEKCLDEVKPLLGPLFQNMELTPDGRFDLKSSQKLNPNLLTEEIYRELLSGLTEVLVAEVLAVKKNLGNLHESALVKNLEKIGEWS